jgi:hypothetical protein
MNVNLSDLLTVMLNVWQAGAIVGAALTFLYFVAKNQPEADALVRNTTVGWFAVAAFVGGFIVGDNAPFVAGLMIGGGAIATLLILIIPNEGADWLTRHEMLRPYVFAVVVIPVLLVFVAPGLDGKVWNTLVQLAGLGVLLVLIAKRDILVPTWIQVWKRTPAPTPATLAPVKFKTVSPLPTATVGTAYPATKVEVEGGSGTGKFLKDGKSPAWALVAPDGTITGTPSDRHLPARGGKQEITIVYIDDADPTTRNTQTFALPVVK